MDVGLNNKNTLGSINKAFSDVVFMVEATSTEKFQLWKENNHEVDWEQINEGMYLQVGTIDNMPITVEFSFAIINKKKVCFYYPTSNAVNFSIVESWIIERFQLTHDNYTRWNHVDAMNFHNCLNSLDRIDKQPRDTQYTGNKILKKVDLESIINEKTNIILGNFFSKEGFNEFWFSIGEETQNELKECIKEQLRKNKDKI